MNVQYYDSILKTDQNQQISLNELVRIIRTGSHRRENDIAELIEKYRSLLSNPQISELERKEFKKNLPCVVVGALGPIRKLEHLTTPTGLMIVDFDVSETQVITDEKVIEVFEDPHVILAFRSPSYGLKILVSIDQGVNAASYKATYEDLITKYFWDKYGLKADQQCKDIGRACYISHDPFIYTKLPTARFTAVVPQEAPVRVTEFKPLTNDTKARKRAVKYLQDAYRALPELDRKEQITSKNWEMMKLQKQAAGMVVAGILTTDEANGIGRAEWSTIYNGNTTKLGNYDKAWARVWNDQVYEFTPPRDIEDEVEIDDVFDVRINRGRFEAVYSFSAARMKQSMRLNEKEAHIITLPIGDVERIFLTRGNVATIVALPSAGKSTHIEAIAAQFMYPEADRLFFKKSEVAKRMLVIDSENKDEDIARTYSNIANRVGCSPYEVADDPAITYVPIFQAEINLDQQLNAYEIVEQLLAEAKADNRPYDLVVFDDVSVLTEAAEDGVNSISASAKVKRQLNKLASVYDCGILCTIHANSAQVNGKARGHVGSELERYGISVLYLRSEHEAGIYRLHGEGVSAKLRRGGLYDLQKIGGLGYVWHDEKGYMTELSSIEIEEIKQQHQIGGDPVSIAIRDLIIEKLTMEGECKSVDVRSQVMDEHGCNQEFFAKRYRKIKEQYKDEWIVLIGGKAGDTIKYKDGNTNDRH